MKKVKILLDSTGDIPKEWLEKYDVSIVPLHITWPNGDKEDDDTRELKDLKEYWKKLRETDKLPVSSQPSPAEFLEIYQEAKNRGYDEILVLCISTAMSGTFNSATLASREIDIPIRVVDTKKASGVNALVAMRARELLNEGKNVEEVGKLLENEIASGRFHAVFYVSNFDYLVKGGRVSKFQGFVGNLLSINVGIYIDHKTGEMIPFKKVRGSKKAQKTLIEKIIEEVPEGSSVDVILVHADNEEGIRPLEEALKKIYNVRSPIDVSYMGKVISTHVGPGTAGFGLYWRKD